MKAGVRQGCGCRGLAGERDLGSRGLGDLTLSLGAERTLSSPDGEAALPLHLTSGPAYPAVRTLKGLLSRPEAQNPAPLVPVHVPAVRELGSVSLLGGHWTMVLGLPTTPCLVGGGPQPPLAAATVPSGPV